MKHIKHYSAVRRMLKNEFDREMDRAKKDITEVEQTIEPRFYQNLRERIDKGIPKEREIWEGRLEAADKAPRLIEIKVKVNWHTNRIGEYNPHAEAWVTIEDEIYGSRSAYGEGRVSGCGYDKKSAAVEEALEFPIKRSDGLYQKDSKRLVRAAIDRFVIEHGEALWSEYAVAKKPIPHLCFGGKGMSVITRLFRRVGCKPYCKHPITDYLIEYEETSKLDSYLIIRKDCI